MWSWAEIDLSCIGWNLKQLRSLVGGARIIAVVKANAYGHGLVEVAGYLEDKVDMLAVASLDEAVKLREAGIKAPILNLFPISPDEAEGVIDWDVTQAVDGIDICRELSRCGLDRGKRARVHLKVDTGMNRAGVWYEEAARIAERIASLPNLHLEGVFTHFASADDPDPKFTFLQLNRFREVLDQLEGKGIRPQLVHAANSAAILAYPETTFNAVRPGLILYGVSPADHLAGRLDLKPALTWKSRVIRVREVEAGQLVGYGRAYRTLRRSKIAVIRAGYADGYSWRLSNCGKVLIRGREAPIVGRVCMDLIMCDVTDIPGAKEGDEAVLIGEDGGRAITAEYMAKLAGTIPYEILTGISGRVRRIYKA